MKRAGLYLRRTAGVLAGLTLLVWLAAGAHRGWTQTSVPVEKLDEVTGLTYLEYRKSFRPGVDFVAAGWLASLFLAGVGWTLDHRYRLR